MYYYYGAQRYEQFLYRSVDCIGYNLVWFSYMYLFPSTYVSLWCYIYILFTSFSLPFIELSLVVLVLDLVD